MSNKNNLICVQKTLLDVMNLINNSEFKIAFVIDEEKRLVGTVTDGDIRRSLLREKSLQVSIDKVMNKNPIYGCVSQSSTDYQKKLKEYSINYLPVIDIERKIQCIVGLNKTEEIQYPNKVVLMVGGLGSRLRPLTEHLPKSMLKIGNKPILQIIIENFKSYGFNNFVLCVNYKKEIIQSYFKNGAQFDVNIEYIEEDKRLGTAGALSLLQHDVKDPIFIMNGDLLTQVDFSKLLEYHLETGSIGTMCVREYEYQIPFGVIQTDEHKLISIQEKPLKKEYVNAGIYMLSPKAIKYIPYHEFYDMPELFNKLISMDMNTSVFPIHEYWMDIGQLADYEQANKDYESVNIND
ncbi:nucleotidyltransferase family protein [Kurthia huakuii]|uniref:nucleotidyltransferase family protein n=1 Tax=Kurthia huakuii TaxID=1421019 RepID=UPI00049655B5|nr:nucleotidyltransferase family protein [Kurthia huakuii]MBM7700751.1 dTDP-glucose pyrophosphorylase [Kurthia huakuii]